MATVAVIVLTYFLASCLTSLCVIIFMRGAGRDFYYQPEQLSLFQSQKNIDQCETIIERDACRPGRMGGQPALGWAGGRMIVRVAQETWVAQWASGALGVRSKTVSQSAQRPAWVLTRENRSNIL